MTPFFRFYGSILYLAAIRIRAFTLSSSPPNIRRATHVFATSTLSPDPSAVSTLLPKGMVQTLAGPYVIHGSSTEDASLYTWSFQTIGPNSNHDDHPSLAWKALHEPQTPENGDCSIQFHVDSASNLIHATRQNLKEENGELFSILEAVAVQWAASHHASTEPWQVVGFTDKESTVLLPLDENPINMFEKVLEKSLGSPEWVEMVDSSGQPLGRVPRPLIHSHNLLHRGIGMFVTKDKSIFAARNENDMPDLYVHQRTASKRIFPSLYDMFVGGVAGAGESSLVTAQREVAEELGLKEPSHLSSQPLLTCVVCTDYNRCVVDLYEYVMDSSNESVSWQAEEVAWGSFCSYALIEAAADRSIQRLATQNVWPGRTPFIQSQRRGELYDTANDLYWREWDFVPDGLLVWEAWLEWRAKR